MSSSLFVTHLLGGAYASTFILCLAIILSTFILEDFTTLVVGILAADHVISVPLALFSLYTGIVAGDLGLYALGYLASTHPRLARFVDHDLIAPLKNWIEEKFVLTIFSARFIPGSRVPTYFASGFFRSGLSTFIPTVIIGMSIWTTFLFGASFWFGSVTSEWLGEARWVLGLIVLVALFLILRYNTRSYRKRRAAIRARRTS